MTITLEENRQKDFFPTVVNIFYDKNEQNDTQTAKNGVFLNQELLDKGYAESY